MVELLPIKPGEWSEFIRKCTEFAIEGTNKLHIGSYEEVLDIARKTAELVNHGVRIAGKMDGKWYYLDTAYPKDFSI
jgi:hypothetical protein